MIFGVDGLKSGVVCSKLVGVNGFRVFGSIRVMSLPGSGSGSGVFGPNGEIRSSSIFLI